MGALFIAGTESAISDHYPVEVDLYSDKDPN